MRASRPPSSTAVASPDAARRSASSCAASTPSAAPVIPDAGDQRAANSSAPAVAVPVSSMPTPTATPGRAAAPSRTAERARDQRPQRHPAGQQQVPAAGLLLAAGHPGGGQRGPDAGEDGEHGAGAPDGEPAGVVEGDRRAEERADGRVLRERGRATPSPTAPLKSLVLRDDDRRQAAADDRDDRRPAAQLAHRGRGDRRAGRRRAPAGRRGRRRAAGVPVVMPRPRRSSRGRSPRARARGRRAAPPRRRPARAAPGRARRPATG